MVSLTWTPQRVHEAESSGADMATAPRPHTHTLSSDLPPSSLLHLGQTIPFKKNQMHKHLAHWKGFS